MSELTVKVEEQIDQIDAKSKELDAQIGDLMSEVWLLEQESERILRRIISRKAKICRLSQLRTEVLNFRLPLEDSGDGGETKNGQT